MEKLKEVEDAKLIMTEAVNWSVMKWLSQKKKVRRMADVANAALDEVDQAVKSRWDKELRSAYEQLCDGRLNSSSLNGEALQLAKKLKHADDEAKRAHDEAELTFDEAERQLSTSMAREGCHKAIRSWELHEKAIHLSETAVRSLKA